MEGHNYTRRPHIWAQSIANAAHLPAEAIQPRPARPRASYSSPKAIIIITILRLGVYDLL